MVKYIVGVVDSHFGEGEFAVVDARNAEDAITRYIKAVGEGMDKKLVALWMKIIRRDLKAVRFAEVWDLTP